MIASNRKRAAVIEGCKASLHNGQILTSTGNPSLDQILGGGMPLGSILLIEEDKFNNYANVIIKYFLAEGVQKNHGICLTSFESNLQDFIKTIPSPCQENGSKNVPEQADEMRIAFRYNQLPKIESELSSFQSLYDLSKPISEDVLNSRSINLYSDMDRGFQGCISNIKNVVNSPDYSSKNDPRNLLRICIKSLGSPLWFCDEDFRRKLKLFLFNLKAIIRHCNSVCLITIPMHLLELIDTNFCDEIRNFVDLSIEIESFAASEKETNPVFKDYHGLIKIKKLAALDTMASFCPESLDLGFKLRRRKFVIEKLHLPPELGENEDQMKNVPKMSCSSGGSASNKLDF